MKPANQSNLTHHKVINEKTLLLIVSPSLGCLDNWLPIISKRKELCPQDKVYIAISASKTVGDIMPEDALIKLTQQLIDGVFSYTLSQKWAFHKTLVEAKELEQSQKKFEIINKIRRALFKFRMSKLVSIYNKIIDMLFVFDDSVFDVLLPQNTQILYDVYVGEVPTVKKLTERFSYYEKISLCHGIYIHDLPPEESPNVLGNPGTRCLLYSKSEESYYHKLYSIPYEMMNVVGVPRHDITWVSKVLSIDENQLFTVNKFKPYLFIVSRPGSTKYFSYEKKLISLQNIKKLFIDEKKLRVIVRIHPKERNQGLYENVFGIENYNKTWCYSELHAYTLAKNAKMAITFFSGVSVDIINLGIPIIQYLEASHGSLNDRTIMNFLMKGFGFYAENDQKLLQFTNQIFTNPENVINMFKKTYESLFPESMPLESLDKILFRPLCGTERQRN